MNNIRSNKLDKKGKTQTIVGYFTFFCQSFGTRATNLDCQLWKIRGFWVYSPFLTNKSTICVWISYKVLIDIFGGDGFYRQNTCEVNLLDELFWQCLWEWILFNQHLIFHELNRTSLVSTIRLCVSILGSHSHINSSLSHLLATFSVASLFSQTWIKGCCKSKLQTHCCCLFRSRHSFNRVNWPWFFLWICWMQRGTPPVQNKSHRTAQQELE